MRQAAGFAATCPTLSVAQKPASKKTLPFLARDLKRFRLTSSTYICALSSFTSHRSRLYTFGSFGVCCRSRKLVVCPGGPAGGLGGRSGGSEGEEVDTVGKKIIVAVAVTYVFLLIVVPVANLYYIAFSKGIVPLFRELADPDFLHAMQLTLSLAAIAVPINTIFGIAAAIALTRNEFPGKSFMLALLDIPFSVSPVITGLMLILLYGRGGLFEPALDAIGLQVVFAFPGMLLATLFVTLPFVARELIPVLESQGVNEEEAARTLGASEWEVFWNVTLPNIRWGLVYGLVLTNARAIGEFGAVAVVSGNIIGQTQTATLYVESAYKEYNTDGAFAAATVLATMAITTVVIKDRLEAQVAKEAQAGADMAEEEELLVVDDEEE